MTTIKGASVFVCAFVVLLGTSHYGGSARAGEGAAFLGGMVTSHILGGFVRRDRARTQAQMHQAYHQPQQTTTTVSSQPAHKNAEQRLDELDELAKKGYISKDEYQTRRKAILDSI